MYLNSEASLLVTASHDKTLGVHRMASDGEQLIEKTMLRVQVPEKINDMVGFGTSGSSIPDLFVGDVSPVISKFVFKS